MGARLRESRARSALSQSQVAGVVGVTRELISMWENEQRTPNLRQLEKAAQVYRVSTNYLMGETELEEGAPSQREVLYRGTQQSLKERIELDKWLDFLDAWADLLEEIGWREELTGREKPPRKLDEGQITDARRAPTSAASVRNHYEVGKDAIPDLSTFLDNLGVLVYRAPLGKIHGGVGVSGAFYNHPKIGYCVLVNSQTSRGRQAFTLAHELAHAFYHYPSGGMVSRLEEDEEPKERFANAFAAHFLVPGKELKKLATIRKWSGETGAYEAIELAAYFRVSYRAMLYRLGEEGIIDRNWRDTLSSYSPRAMAQRLGLDQSEFTIPDQETIFLERYPVSVIERVRKAVHDNLLTVSQAADVLGVPQHDMQRSLKLLSQPPEAGPEEQQELGEYPRIHPSNKRGTAV